MAKRTLPWLSTKTLSVRARRKVDILNRFKAAWEVLLHGYVSQKPSPPVCDQASQPFRTPGTSSIVSGKLLSGKSVLITGAGKNIGRSTALEMAAQGANVFFTDIDKPSLERLERELAGFQTTSLGFFSDISDVSSVDELCGFLEKKGIVIDVLVNNVGIQHENATQIKKLELKEWHDTFRTNVFGPLYLTKLISQMMIKNKTAGSIVFITSIHDTTIRRIPSYSASKAALGMVVKELAMELAPNRIRVNGIAPGGVLEENDGNSVTCIHVPLHQSWINPVYIGRTAVYLSSQYFSKFTTGTIIKIDAGATLHNHLSVLETYLGKSNV
jgi:NAD(P)-dependent dehydrogenase (short-subunit alcohol dehydrogenase family)